MNNPLIHIAIPTYNSEKTIIQTLNSVFLQTYQNFKVFIYDNCSTDNTIKLIKTLNDNRLLVFQNTENIGMIGNWNKCLTVMTDCDFFQLLCSDDIIYPTYFEEKLAIFKKYLDVVLITNATDIVNANGKKLFTRINLKEKKYSAEEALKISKLKGNIFGEPSSVLFRTPNKLHCQFTTTTQSCLDWEFFINFLSTDFVYAIRKPLSQFRISNYSGSAKLIQQVNLMIEEHNIIINLINNKLNLEEKCIDILIRNLYFYLKFFVKNIIFILQRR